MLYRLTVVACGLLISVVGGGCSTVDQTRPDYHTDYKKSTTIPPLEMPPDLIHSTEINEQLTIPDLPTHSSEDQSEPTRTTTSTSKGVSVLPTFEQVQLKHRNGIRWLILQGEPETFWPKIKQFWQENGFTLKIEDPRIGILETEWAENRADIPQDGVRKYLGRILGSVYSAPTRDKFRVRLERGAAGTTELYLTHRGAQEVNQGEALVVWQRRPSDPELEAEMLHRLLVFLGFDKTQADTLLANESNKLSAPKKAELIKTTHGMALVLQDDYSQAWQRVGLALDRSGIAIEDQEAEQGLYFIRYIDSESKKNKEGFFGRWFGQSGFDEPKEQEYLIHLIAEEAQVTRLEVLNQENQIANSETAEEILTLLHKQLK